jgi:hypothetical protein
MAPPVGRRAFVVGSAAMLAAAACGKKGKEADRPTITTPSSTTPADAINLLVASSPILAGAPDERVALIVLQGQDAVAADVKVEVLFGQVQGQSVGATIGPFTAERHADGLPRPYHLVRATFPVPGNYAIQATVGDKKGLAALEAADPATDKAPKVGEAMVSVPTPTPSEHRGVEPICTHQPVCPLHDVSLDAALREGKPLAVLFGTPKFCKTNTCGPVLDVMLDVMGPFAAKVRFLHVEIFTDEKADTTTPAVDAYNLQGEPFLFLAGADGKVKGRIPGPYDKAELTQALTALVG